MKHLALATLSLSLVGPTIGFAGNPTPPIPLEIHEPSTDARFYVGADAGVFWLDKLSAGSGLSVDIKFKSGWGIDVPFGYDFGNGAKVGVSLGYEKVEMQQLTGRVGGVFQDASTKGSVEMMPVMANGSYSFKLVGNLNWTIGAGLGAVHTKTSFSTYDDTANKTITFGQLDRATAAFDGLSNSSWDFGFKAFTGLSYQFCPNASFDVGYHYLFTNDKFSVNGSSSNNMNGQMAVAGLLFKF